MIKIIDYGLGNIRSFLNVYKRFNIQIEVARNKNDLINASRLILPGVGSFDHAMTLLNNSGMRDKLDQLVLSDYVPVLGICVGMQILANNSEEGVLGGLGWIKGTIAKFTPEAEGKKLLLPHMGWNDVNPLKKSILFQDIKSNPIFYFLHSYHFICEDESNALSETIYNGAFTSSVNSGKIYGVQFHPEKSHTYGMKLLTNFTKV